MRPTIPSMAATLLAAAVLSLGAAGAALAESSGGYSSPQQDCQWHDDDWNTPTYTTYPGCHNEQVTVESGGMTNGNPNNGYNNSKRHGEHGAQNTTWFQFGLDQEPIDPNAKGTPTFYSLGYPGQSTSPHAGCVSFNTDGTNGGAAKNKQKPKSPSKAYHDTKYGCGNNTKGTGFAINFDYYQYYCPVAKTLSKAKYPYACENVPGGDQGPNSVVVDDGGKQNLTDIAQHGVIVYYGQDDNSDNGEHDGEGPYSTSKKTHGTINGASDGGAIMVALTPQTAKRAPSKTQPEGLANASAGFCADENCAAVETQQQEAYEGCGANTGNNAKDDACPKGRENSQRDSYDYQNKHTDPYNCSSGGEQNGHHDGDDKAKGKTEPDSGKACDTSKSNPSPSGDTNKHGGMDYWRRQEAHHVYNEPGVQVYGDPDASGSPAAPLHPDPSLYVGTCGVYAGGGVVKAPKSPVTNKAGQVAIRNGC